ETVEVDVRVVLASNQPLEDLVASGQFRQDLYYRINVVKIELPPLRERSVDIPLLAEHFLDRYTSEMKRHIAGFSPDALSLLKRYSFPGNVRELENAVQHAVVLCRRGIISPDDLPPTIVESGVRRLEAGTAGVPAVADRPAKEASADAGAGHPVKQSGGRSADDGRSATEVRPEIDHSHNGSSTPSVDAIRAFWRGEALSVAMERVEREVLLAALDHNKWNRQRTSDQLNINRTTLYKKMRHHGLDSIADAG
ncbi:MAG: helix-turn-helix domain-containing protein, partial [Planctomycetota bacterium]